MDDQPVRRSFEERGERRVVVTGMGAITSLGNDVASTWEAMQAGRSGIGPITLFDPSNVDAKIGGEIRGFEPERIMPRKEIRRNDRYIHYAWAATTEALADAGLPNPIDSEELAERTGAIIGSGIGGINTMIRDIIEAHEYGMHRVGPFLVTAMIADMAPGYVAIYANARGPNYTTVSACASSNHAIGDALNIIRRGDADVMIVGGAEAGIGEIPVAAFSAMRALSTKRNDEPQKASRPFDAQRDGFVMGDGSGILVLEALDHARARGAGIHAELVGYAATDDASHITLPAPGGRGAVASMRLALADAGLADRRRRLHQRPRHEHAGERQRGDGRDQDRLRRARRRHPRLIHEVDDRSHAGCRRRRRSDRLRAGHRGWGGAAHDQLRVPRSGLRPRLRPEPGAAGCGARRDQQLLRLRRAQRDHRPSPLGGRRVSEQLDAQGPERDAERRSAILAAVDRLAPAFVESGLEELEVESGELLVRLARPRPVAEATPGVAQAPQAAPRAPSEPAPSSAYGEPQPGMRFVTVPLTGVWYSAPSPGARPYVTEGSEIATGQVIGLIEAMKLFNEIKSDAGGTVTRILVESGTLVKRQQPVLEIDPR